MTQEDATTKALSHLLDEPAELTLSGGDTVQIWSVTPRVTFRIAAQRERLRWALQQYRAFVAASSDPAFRAWEKNRRLAFWNRRWLVELERTCEMMLTACLKGRAKGRFRWVRVWKERRRIRGILRSASWQDWMKIVEQYQKFHDVEAIAEVIFGPAPADEVEKKTLPSSGPTSSSLPSVFSASP